MARKLQLGEIGEPEVTGQYRDELGRWRKHPTGRGRGVERLRARVYYRGHDGVMRDLARFGPPAAGARAQLAKDVVDAAKERMRIGSGITSSARTPFVTAGNAWLALIARSDSGKSEKTVDDYTKSWKRLIDVDGSTLRGLTLGQVNEPARIRAFLQRVADKHGTGSAKMAKSVISGILQQAVHDGVLSANASRQVRPVKAQNTGQRKGTGIRTEERDTERALTREERDELIEIAYNAADAEGIDPRTSRKLRAAADLLALMAGTGLRISEARTLRWESVDLHAGTVTVTKAKTRAGERTLNLPPWLRKRLRKRQKATGKSGYVFPAPAPRVPDPERSWEQSNAAGAVADMFRLAGMPWATPHTLRRTVATLLHEAGVPIARIADQLGHADPAMTASVYLGRDFEGDKADLAAHL